jgi:hypothetical protein
MIEWKSFSGERRCGLCGRTIAAGEPMLVITGTSVDLAHHWKIVRCRGCAVHTHSVEADNHAR